MTIDTIIYTGPSLSHREARAIYPEGCFHEPIKCGDLIKASRLNPKRIAIIDGFFEQTGSIWHKEILFLLSQGVEVYGASSMGALRAAELNVFGMKGFGIIYESYSNGLMDDDDVALVHDSNFQTRIPAYFNIKVTLTKACNEQVISSNEKEKLLSTFKQKPYFERDFFNSLNNQKLKAWCEQNYIDQKKQDAIDLIKHLAKTSSPNTTACNFNFEPTLYFHKIYREMIVSPFDKAYAWLPKHEQQAASHGRSDHFKSTLRLAKLEHLCHDLNLQPCAPNSTLSRFLSIYDSNLDTLAAGYFQALLNHMSDLDISINAAKKNEFLNQFRFANGLISVEATEKWIKSNQLTMQQFNDFCTAIGTFKLLIDEHNGHLLGAKLSFDKTDYIFDAMNELKQTELA